MLRTKIAIAVAVILAASILLPSRRATAASGPRWGADYFPNVPLITQDGKKVHFYDDLLKGKIVAIELIYTHCIDSCPLETARLAQVQKALGDRVGKDIFFYSISIDPKRDTPEVLKAYAEKYHAGPGWLFLTGKYADIELISKKLGLYSDPDLNNRDGHTTQLMVGNVPAGQWMRNAATDNPHLLANFIANFMGGWNSPRVVAATSYASVPALKIGSQGQYLFATRCAACHTIGHGIRVGPDLAGVTNVRDRNWLLRFIQKPDEMLAAKDPLATLLFKQYKQVQMPNLRLGPEDTEYLVKYLEAQAATGQGNSNAAAANTLVRTQGKSSSAN